MSDDRKRSVWPWIVALLIGLPVLYIASFGPACWIFRWGSLSEGHLRKAYGPILDREEAIPAGIRRAASWYSGPAEDGRDMVLHLNRRVRVQLKLQRQVDRITNLLDEHIQEQMEAIKEERKAFE